MEVCKEEKSLPAGKETKEMFLEEVAFNLDLVLGADIGIVRMKWKDFICLIMKCFLVEFG